jgi:heme-degrading monooxygenase HmoA
MGEIMKIRSQIVRELIAASILAVLVFIPSVVSLLAQPQRPEARQTPSARFPDLVGALRATPGCLGVEAAGTSSGKQVIFAWFEDKRAVLNWYNSEAHQKAMQLVSGRTGRAPLAGIGEDAGPIMAIASLTLSDKTQSDIASLPVSQIAIELYGPLPGGIALGGRFAPDSVKVPGLFLASIRSGRFLRIHRSTLVNLASIAEVPSLFGSATVKLKDSHATELSVARDRVKVLKESLGI